MKIQAKDWKKLGLHNGVGRLTFEAEDVGQAALLATLFRTLSGLDLLEQDLVNLDLIASVARKKFGRRK